MEGEGLMAEKIRRTRDLGGGISHDNQEETRTSRMRRRGKHHLVRKVLITILLPPASGKLGPIAGARMKL